VVPLAIIVYLLAQGVMGKGAGSDSPEGAVRKLVEATNRQDPTGAMSALAPEEITSVRRLYKSVVDKAQQGKVITATAHPLDGLDLRLDGLTYTTTALGSGVARVNLTGGTLGYKVDSTAASPLLNELGGANGRTTDSTTVSGVVADIDGHNRQATNPLSGLYAVAVKRQGRWYVSPEYTLAEYLREDAGLPRPGFTGRNNTKPTGAASAKEAVTTFANALSSVDPHRIITALPPEELGVLYDYEQDLRTDIERSQGLKASDVKMTLDPPDVSESPIADGRVRVDINRLSGVLAADNGRGRSARVNFTLSGTCLNAQVRTQDPYEGTNTDSTKKCASDASPALRLARFFVVVVNDGGKWYVDPVATIAEYAKTVVDAATPADVECLVRRGAQRGADKTESVCSQSPMFRSGG